MNNTNEQAIATPAKSSPINSTVIWLSVMVLLWGLSWPATKLALNTVPPLWLAAIRFGSAGVCLFFFVALKKELRLPARQDLPIILSIGILQMVVFTGLGMIAMQFTDTSHAVLLAYTTPLWGTLVSWLLLRQTPSAMQIVALAIGLAGIALICSPAEMDWSRPGVIMGCAFLLTGAIAWSLVIVHVKHHKWAGSPLSLAPWQMLLATLPLVGFAAFYDGSPATIHFSAHVLWLLFFIGPIATSFCFVISSEHGRRISVFGMSNFTLGVPFIGALASVMFLGSTLSWLFITGLVLVFVGVSVTALSASKRKA